MYLKILFSGLFLFVFSTSNLFFGQCGSTTFEYQWQIDNFATDYPDCTEIQGVLRIKESYSGDITNLNGLSQITKVKYLRILDNAALTSLEGLHNISSLTDGISSGQLYIINNSSLQNLNALANLQEVSSDIRILENPLLTSIEGLHNISIRTSGLRISIEDNPSLSNILGLEGIIVARSLNISNNVLLTNLNGINNLTELTGGLGIIQNQNLINLEGLNNLINVGEQGVSIYGNPTLETLNGLENLITIGDGYFSNNPALINIEALGNLTSSANAFAIAGSPLLTNLKGLENLTSALAIFFESNTMLSDISNIENIDFSNVSILSIHYSPLLAVCNYPNICQYLEVPSNDADIYYNAPGCSSRQEILQACGLIGIDEFTTVENFTIHPNPTNGSFNISGIDEGTLQITDSGGRVLKTFSLEKDKASVSGLAEGIYFVNISNEKGSSTKRIIKI